MSNELTNPAATAVLNNIMASIQNTMTQAPVVVSKAGMKFLKFDAKGWVMGREAEEVMADDRFAVAAENFTHGYVAWHGGRPEFQRMIPTGESLASIELPDPATLKAKHGIEDARGMACFAMDGPCAGDPCEFSTNSRGGREAIEGVMRAIFERGAAGHADVYPVITLSTETYNHPEHGPITKPVFTIVEWMDQGDVAEVKMLESEAEEIPLGQKFVTAREDSTAEQPEDDFVGKLVNTPPDPAPAPEKAPRRRRA